MINIQQISLRLGTRLLFENVNLVISDQQKIGLIGSNGSGKSSFFKLLLKEYQPDSGQIHIPRHLRMGHLAQDVPPLLKSALEFVIDGDQNLRRIEQDLKNAEQQNKYEQLAILHQHFTECDGYTAATRAAKLLHGLGFSEAMQHKAVKDFSGGWRTRLSLAQTLMCPTDMLLLDEPTNHLDLDAILWLEKWLQRYPGALLIISHDRLFLDNCVEQIVHIDNQQMKIYHGNYSAFEKLRAEQMALQQKTYEKQQRQIAHMMDFVNRFRAKASKAKQAQSRLKAIQNIDLIAAVQVDSPFHFEFTSCDSPPNPLLTLTNIQVAYPSHPQPILKKVNLQIIPGMRAGLLGPNGAGKSTLIKLLAGQLKSAQGEYYSADGLKIGYYAQHQIEQLTFNQSPLWHLQQLDPIATMSRLRQFLGGFDFSGDMALASIEKFSGGEKARLALALLVWQSPHLLLLDEPTNHLDLEMRNALTLALQSFQGALILVSHDRYLLQTTADEFFLVANHQVLPFPGDLNDYQQWLFNERRTTEKKAVKKIDNRKLQEQVTKLEKELHKGQTVLTQIEQQLADNSLYSPENKLHLDELLNKQQKLAQQVRDIESRWLEISEQLES